ncbi:type I restriction endonuclease subunit R [Limnospira platensis]|uniref:type I restriction endonuclease subunit R n=1 Tax=Limnospira platensis TaxID=118562 RepID=UPI003D6F36A2
MIKVGQVERVTQNRVIKLFQNQLGYTYLGNWKDRENNGNIEAEYLTQWLTQQGIKDTLINKTLRELDKAASLGETQNLYDANKAVYRLLRYGVKVKGGAGEQTQTVWLIDWENPDNNRFYLAEEVTIKGNHRKRPDIVVYINGIAVAVLELKRSTVSVAEGIRQNLDNQKKEFIRPFFTTLQLVMAGNDTQGLRYGTIETSEKYYLEWKEAGVNAFESLLDWHLSLLCEKSRLLELIHDFIIFDAGIKKTCRHNQYFGIKVAQEFIQRLEGGIIWHTQGSGKSLTMVWLAKWIREHQRQARVLIISDRTELDQQISSIFKGVDEEIYRTQSSADLMNKLNQTQPWLMCSLIHKFGHSSQEATEEFINSLQQLPSNFSPKGNLFVFVDECHRTQSGKLHTAMKQMLPNALFIGFTGTPLLKQDKQRSIEVFGGYIHTYKFNEAVRDGVILDLRYEARDIDQTLTSPQKIDQWFEAKTRGLSEFAKTQLKKKWGTMQKLLSSKSRLEQIVNDILLDMETKPRLMDGRGNAMLVCSSIYQACKTYEILSQTDFKGKCAIITSYKPSPADIKGEETGEGLTEKLHQYGIYRRMLADYFNQPEDEAMYRVGEFEQEVKRRFIDEPGQMRLLIVVDKLLTGFDAPPATYLYIDKTMRDHGLFQAICRVNRLDGEDKEYGYIVDYKDLFQQLEGAVTDYTSGAFEDYEAADVAGLLSDRLSKGQERLETALEAVRALCEPVPRPRHTSDYLHYFCAADTTDKTALTTNEPQRVALYQTVNALIRAYSNLANEMEAAGYTPQEAASIKEEVSQYSKMRDEVKIASGDYIDSKIYEPAMRHLMDTYIRAEPSNLVADFEELGLVQLMVNQGLKALDSLPEGLKDEEIMAETIENNIRKIILDQSPINPKYYEEMSELLDALIAQRHQQAISYQEYLEQVKQLARQVIDPTGSAVRNYPPCLNTPALRSLYDNLGKNEAIALAIDEVVKTTKKDGWIGNRFKEREVKNAVDSVLSNAKLDPDLDQLLELIKQQHDYQ